jgi:hypothetical protein
MQSFRGMDFQPVTSATRDRLATEHETQKQRRRAGSPSHVEQSSSTSKHGANTTMPDSAQKTQSILQAVDELLRRVIAWTQDSHGTPIMPAAVANQIQVVDELCQSTKLPELFMPLHTASGRIMVEYEGYLIHELGKYRPENGSPGPGFWASMKELAVARQEADQPPVERLEPVSTLLPADLRPTRSRPVHSIQRRCRCRTDRTGSSRAWIGDRGRLGSALASAGDRSATTTA